MSRNQRNLTAWFPEIVADLKRLRARNLVLDCEVAAFDENLVSHLGYLRTPRRRSSGVIITPPILVAFDCLLLGGKDLCSEPLAERRERLERALRNSGRHLLIARRLSGNGLEAWAEVKRKGYEGLVAKREDSPYVPGAVTANWFKVKHRIRVGWPEEGIERRRV